MLSYKKEILSAATHTAVFMVFRRQRLGTTPSDPNRTIALAPNIGVFFFFDQYANTVQRSAFLATDKLWLSRLSFFGMYIIYKPKCSKNEEVVSSLRCIARSVRCAAPIGELLTETSTADTFFYMIRVAASRLQTNYEIVSKNTFFTMNQPKSPSKWLAARTSLCIFDQAASFERGFCNIFKCTRVLFLLLCLPKALRYHLTVSKHVCMAGNASISANRRICSFTHVQVCSRRPQRVEIKEVYSKTENGEKLTGH